eukprot:CAMPEP_0177688754 /NCGR_PEP_ID=MMETSP0447-20121125/34817_1 /TAXON_ID=0 /ORGANISM="Stygamoeba regulata, Strain BSH-02190019" /LENGTH=112 /DNA_ID=CAMNT_0019199057 /DNA_START=325 /DNA_END=660 /DNA_ORIENTATION=-
MRRRGNPGTAAVLPNDLLGLETDGCPGRDGPTRPTSAQQTPSWCGASRPMISTGRTSIGRAASGLPRSGLLSPSGSVRWASQHRRRPTSPDVRATRLGQPLATSQPDLPSAA